MHVAVGYALWVLRHTAVVFATSTKSTLCAFAFGLFFRAFEVFGTLTRSMGRRGRVSSSVSIVEHLFSDEAGMS